MKVSFLSENIIKLLSFVNHAVSSKNQLLVLLNLLIEAEKGKIKISATDLEIGIQIEIPAKVEKEGSITVPARVFSDLILSLPNEKIDIETKDNNLLVVTKKTKSTFQTSPAVDFPKLYEEKGEKTSEFKKEEFIKNIKKIIFAASNDLGRPALCGVLIKKGEQGTILVSTDGYRLSVKKQEKEKEKEEKQILIPARILKETSQAPGEEDIELYISSKTNQVVFTQGGIIIVGRLIDAVFPAYEKIIPQEYETSTIFDREEAIKAVKICSIFARETANIIKFSVKKDKIIVSANTPSVGQNSVDIEAKTTGEENEIAFNARYLLELLSNIEESEILFEMTGPLNPGVFKIAGDKTFLHMIMPIRVQT